MIEVVQVGTYINKENRKYRVQCWRCNAIFRFDKEDSLYDPFEYGRYIRCPQCHAMTDYDKWIENKTKHKDSIEEHSVYPVKNFKIELNEKRAPADTFRMKPDYAAYERKDCLR